MPLCNHDKTCQRQPEKPQFPQSNANLETISFHIYIYIYDYTAYNVTKSRKEDTL